jgi:hypothetical protein
MASPQENGPLRTAREVRMEGCSDRHQAETGQQRKDDLGAIPFAGLEPRVQGRPGQQSDAERDAGRGTPPDQRVGWGHGRFGQSSEGALGWFASSIGPTCQTRAGSSGWWSRSCRPDQEQCDFKAVTQYVDGMQQ